MQKHYPLLQAQSGIFRDWEAHPGSLRYNLPAVARFKGGEVDAQRLQRALQQVFSQRQILHTRFFLDSDGQPRQYADPSLALPIHIHRMTEDEVQAYLAQDFVRPFHLLNGEPLCRWEIVETAEALYLLVDFHHCIADGLTIAQNFIHRDLPLAYGGQPLPPDNLALYEQAEREQAVFASERYQKAADYHRRRFADVTFPALDSRILSPSDGVRISPLSGGLEGGLFLAAFALVLSKHTHSLQVAFSTLIHGRSGKRQREAYGMFVESLPLCIDIDNSLSVRDFIQQVQRELTAALRHRAYPIGHFYRDLKKRPSVVFGFQGVNIAENMCIGGHQAQGIQLHQEETLDDSCLVYTTKEGQFEVRGIMAQAVAECARNLALHPEAPLTDIAMLTPEAEGEMIQLAQGPRMAYDERETVVDMILRQAQKTPERTAIVDATSSITYGELDRMSAEVARTVSQPFVCVPANRSLQFVVSALGIMRAGSAYVPIDEEWPEPRRAAIEQSVANHIKLPSLGEGVGVGISYVIYTSGTTGEPKGIVIPHRGLTNLVHFLVSEWHITDESRISCHSSFAFDASVEDIFPVLTVGGTLFIPNEEERHDLRMMYQFLERHQITGGCYTTQFGVLLSSRYPLHVSYLCLGGEKLYPFTPCIDQPPSGSVSDGITVAPPPYRIFNTYGPTEFTVDATFHEWRPAFDHEDIPIGRPLPNCAAYVVDPQGRPVPRGVVGELLLAGPQLAMNVATPQPPSPTIPHPVYPTGDLVRWNNQGELEYIGRKDRMLKFRGYRINPIEIERTLTAVSGIEAAAVRLEGSFLCAYYQAQESIAPQTLRRQLSESLPSYMLPNRFIQLETLPLDSHGKTDWTRLPSLLTPHPSPLTPHPSLLTALFARILQTEEIQPDDDFFDLGGTSLHALLLVEELQKAGFAVSYGDIFRFPTPRSLQGFLQGNNTPRSTSFTNEMHTEVRPCKNPTIPLSPSFILTGATGYLGIHLLHELLATLPQTKVLCIVRAADEEKARMRLAETYRHYFPDASVLEEARVKAIPGDITSPELFSHLSLLTPHPSLFIHCAADVRYFAPHSEIERTNIEGTRLVAAFCREHAIRLVHISTLSVLQHRFTFSYIESKRQAEQWVQRLCCVSGGPVTAQILRIGFLAPRSTDGMFQQNPDRSAFFSLLQWLRQMDCFPTSMAKMQPDVMPVDQAARLILHHALHPNPSEAPINLTHPTPLSSLLPHATEVSDTEFLCRLNQHPEPPIAVRTWMNILFEEKYSDKN